MPSMDLAAAQDERKLRPAPRPERFTPWVVGGALFLQTLDATIVATALPTMARALDEPTIRLNSTITIYLLASAIFIPISGWLADRFGSKAVFRTSILVFTAASVLCGLAPNLEALLAARFLQGAAAAMITPVGRLLIVQRHDKADLVRAMAFLGIPIVVGPVVGPPLGGFIVQYFTWNWIFFVNIPIGLAMALLVERLISDIRSDGPKDFDFRGFLISAAGAALLVYGLSLASEPGSPASVWLLAVAAGAALGAGYVFHAKSRAGAILDLNVLRTPTFRIALVGSVALRLGSGATPFLLALLLQLQFGMDPLSSGLVTLTIAAAALLMKTTAQPIIKRFGYKRVLVTNTIITAATLMLWGAFQPGTPLLLMIILLLIGGFFRSLQFTSLNTLIFADLHAAQVSRGSSLASMMQQLADSVGIAVCAIILSIAAESAVSDSLAISICFVFLGAANLLALPLFLRMPSTTGDAVRGR